jgi:hypothetical protein
MKRPVKITCPTMPIRVQSGSAVVIAWMMGSGFRQPQADGR